MYNERRQNFRNFYGGRFMPDWRNHTQTYQPQILAMQIPPWMNQHLSAHGSSALGIKNFKGTDSKVVTKSKAQKQRDYERRKTFLERKTICFLMPGAELMDKEFRKLFSWPTNQPNLEIVNNALICSLKLAEDRIKGLENDLEQLKSTAQLVQKQHSEELQQSQETLSFHKFNTEVCRLKIEDLEERNKQLQENFNQMNSACSRLLEDKEQLTGMVQSCLENLDKYKQFKLDITSTSKHHAGNPHSKEKNGQIGGSDFERLTPEGEFSCEWCNVVRAFYRIQMPT